MGFDFAQPERMAGLTPAEPLAWLGPDRLRHRPCPIPSPPFGLSEVEGHGMTVAPGAKDRAWSLSTPTTPPFPPPFSLSEVVGHGMTVAPGAQDRAWASTALSRNGGGSYASLTLGITGARSLPAPTITPIPSPVRPERSRRPWDDGCPRGEGRGVGFDVAPPERKWVRRPSPIDAAARLRQGAPSVSGYVWPALRIATGDCGSIAGWGW